MSKTPKHRARWRRERPCTPCRPQQCDDPQHAAVTHLTNGFSKKVENRAYAVALHMKYYNFVRLHSKLRMSPAMAAGVTDKLWEIGDIVTRIEAKEADEAWSLQANQHPQIS